MKECPGTSLNSSQRKFFRSFNVPVFVVDTSNDLDKPWKMFLMILSVVFPCVYCICCVYHTSAGFFLSLQVSESCPSLQSCYYMYFLCYLTCFIPFQSNEKWNNIQYQWQNADVGETIIQVIFDISELRI